MAEPVLFMVVKSNNPIFTYDFEASKEGAVGGPSVSRSLPARQDAQGLHSKQLILFAALDSLEQNMWDFSTSYHKEFDSINDYLVSGYVTCGSAIFLLLHKSSEDDVKKFFQAVQEMYTKAVLNPFFDYTQEIQSKGFVQAVRELSKRYL